MTYLVGIQSAEELKALLEKQLVVLREELRAETLELIEENISQFTTQTKASIDEAWVNMQNDLKQTQEIKFVRLRATRVHAIKQRYELFVSSCKKSLEDFINLQRQLIDGP